MIRYTIENDRVVTCGAVDKLGFPASMAPHVTEVIESHLKEQGIFPFTRCCFSLGDWGIVSGMPRALNEKYPGMITYIPSANWLRRCFPDVNSWTHQGSDPALYPELVFKNNPHVKFFEEKQFAKVWCDHERSFKFDNEPLVEQILRAIGGFTEQEINTIDSRPDLYFSDEEIQIGNAIINKFTNANFGCMLFASRLKHLDNCWDKNQKNISNLIKTIKKKKFDKDYPIFYYSSFPIEESYWADIFNTDLLINFATIEECDLRIQWYIKSKAKFNISYQSGFNDTVTKYSDHYVATHRIGTGETTMKGVTYFQNDGAIIKYE